MWLHLELADAALRLMITCHKTKFVCMPVAGSLKDLYVVVCSTANADNSSMCPSVARPVALEMGCWAAASCASGGHTGSGLWCIAQIYIFTGSGALWHSLGC